MAGKYVLGIDVGTGSVRAGVFDLEGNMLGVGVCPIEIWKPEEDYAEQSSENIWEATRVAVQEALSAGRVRGEEVVGLSYDATTSLVVLDREGKPLSIAKDGDPQRNIIMWMDHRALAEAAEINEAGYDVLKYVGGVISPEMEPPKLLWLKRNLPDRWQRAGKFFDLADFMVYKSTGLDVRSLCTVVCKWLYLGHERRWDKEFYKALGLEDIFEDERVVEDVRLMGSFVGGLTREAAQHLGLREGAAVGVGIIDAHAGAIGALGSIFEEQEELDTEVLNTAAALIAGTSSCIMAASPEARFIPGVWGPYYEAFLPGMWLTEAGQSAAGGLIEYIIENNAQKEFIREEAKRRGITPYELLNEHVAYLKEKTGCDEDLTVDLHVLPYNLGNRSPKADPFARGIVEGLSLDTSIDAVAKLYYATLQALGYGIRDIIETLNRYGYNITRINATGGGAKNPLWLQEHADITGCRIHLQKSSECMLLGTAILGAVAAGEFPDIFSAQKAMCHGGEVIEPRSKTKAYHDAKYRIFQDLYKMHLEHRRIMEPFRMKE